MAFLWLLAAAPLFAAVLGRRNSGDEQILLGFQEEERGDCSWAKFDSSSGWKCSTAKKLTGGMQGNTQVVELTPPGGKKFKAVLKEMNSNQNPMGLHSLENERRVAAKLMKEGFQEMPMYYLDIAVDPMYVKYKNSATMTLGEKDRCDSRRLSAGICALNPLWNACNGNRGNIDTLKEIPLSRMRKEGLKCPDTQILAMEFLDGYANLGELQPTLRQESGFVREVRAAALFTAYDKLQKHGVSHCDFNTGNAMFNKADPSDAKIIDFGLARTNDHPFGACRGNLEDVGRPGFLWLALYRGSKDEVEQSRPQMPGSLSLSANAPFQTPTGKTMQPFGLMTGKYNGKGGVERWAAETRDNWPGITAYAAELLKEFGPRQQQGNRVQVHQAITPVVKEGEVAHPTTTTTPAVTAKPQTPQAKPTEGLAIPACVNAYKERSAPSVCALVHKSSKRCSVKVSCNGKVRTVELDPPSGFGSSRVDNCYNCKLLH